MQAVISVRMKASSICYFLTDTVQVKQKLLHVKGLAVGLCVTSLTPFFQIFRQSNIMKLVYGILSCKMNGYSVGLT